MVTGDQASADNIIDVYEHRGGHIMHKQVECRGGRVYLRLRKRSITGMLRG